MINKHMKKCSISLVRRRLQIKTTISLEWQSNNDNTERTTCWHYVEEVGHSYTSGVNVKWYIYFGNNFAVSYKVKHTPIP